LLFEIFVLGMWFFLLFEFSGRRLRSDQTMIDLGDSHGRKQVVVATMTVLCIAEIGIVI
jgi:hypothetical protein